jgi:hypothetical protein
VKVTRTGDSAGVSWSWAALTSVNNGAWLIYFTMSKFWTALVPASSATLLAGFLALVLGSRDGVDRRTAGLLISWTVALAAGATVGGRTVLGAMLAATFILQVAPSVWTAYRDTTTDRHISRHLVPDLRRVVLLGGVRVARV